MIGVALATNGVTVNSGAADRKGEYYHREIAIANGSTSVWQAVSVSSGGSTSNGGFAFPRNVASPTYDYDGNLTYDAMWYYSWDGENRLKEMSMNSTDTATFPATRRQRLQFAYDQQGRRIQKIMARFNGSSFTNYATNRFVYDGWNLIAELDHQGNPLRSYAWGQDLSGTMHQAGGVGGLLLVKDHAGSTAHFAGYDGNGNVTSLIKSDGSVSARYEYSPFGEPLRVTGSGARLNPFRWSTKFTDEESALAYYGYRYYSPLIGRWLSRDPIEEKGGVNLVAFVANGSPNRIDSRGANSMETTGDGYSMRLDTFNNGGSAQFEVHVYHKGNEQGIFTRDGYINKHGISGALADANIPEHIRNKVNGMAVDFERRAGRIPQKGFANIKNGAWRGGGANLNRGAALMLVGAIVLAASGDALAANLGNATVDYIQQAQSGADSGFVDLAAIDVALATQDIVGDSFITYSILEALLE